MASGRRVGLTRWLAVAIVAELVLGILGTFVPVVRPHEDPVARADAVVVLAGDHGERLAEARRLIDAGVAPTLVWAGELDSARAVNLCRGTHDFAVVCLRPPDDSTDAEARATARLAATMGWRTLVVVTTTYHVTRARTYFERCFPGRVRMVGAPPSYGVRLTLQAVVHEWLGNLEAAFVNRSC